MSSQPITFTIFYHDRLVVPVYVVHLISTDFYSIREFKTCCLLNKVVLRRMPVKTLIVLVTTCISLYLFTFSIQELCTGGVCFCSPRNLSQESHKHSKLCVGIFVEVRISKGDLVLYLTLAV